MKHMKLSSFLVLLVPIFIFLASNASCNSNPALNAFFSELDKNHDGSIDANEASKFIGGSIGGQEFDEPQEAAEAAASFLTSIDGGDAGNTVSVDELDIHLHNVLSGVRVWEWIRHGLGLPQYSEAFRRHSITPLDFPVLVQHNGRVLEEELGVASPFHRAKLVRAIRLQILGLGSPPSEPQLLACNATPSGTASNAGPSPGSHPGSNPSMGWRVAVRWAPPAIPGRPPLHRYVLEGAAADGRWRPLAEVDDAQPAAVVLDWGAAEAGLAGPGFGGGGGGLAGVEAAEAEAATGELVALPPLPPALRAGGSGGGGGAGSLVFRVSAWNVYGRSPYGTAVCAIVAADGTPPAAGYVSPGNATAGAVAGAAAGWGPASLLGESASCGSAVGEQQEQQLRPGDQPPLGKADGGAAAGSHLRESSSVPAGGGGAGTRTGSAGGRATGGGEAGGARWWNSLLLLVLPWLLRLLPVPVLRRVVEAAQELLLRVCEVAGRQPPEWMLLEPPPPPPLPPPGMKTSVVPPPPPPASLRLKPQVASVGVAPGVIGARTALAAAAPGVVAAAPGSRAAVPWGERLDGSAGMTEAAAAGPPAAPATAAVPISVSNPRGVQQQPYARSVTGVAAAAPLGTADSPSDAAGLLYGSPSGGAGGSPGLLTRASAAISAVAAGLGSPPRPWGPPPAARLLPAPSCPHRPSGCAPHRSSSEGDLGGEPAAANQHASNHAHMPASPQRHHHLPHGSSAPALAEAAAPFARFSAAAAASTSGSAAASGDPHRLPHVGSADGLVMLRAAPAAAVSQGAPPGVGRRSGSGNGGGGGGEGGAEVEAEALELAAAAVAGVGSGWQQQGPSGRDRDRVCAIPGCGRKLDLRHFREYSRRHYCGRCQQTVCGAHTAYSPHGATGSCGHESRCVCSICFTHFNPAYQHFLRQRNTLQPPQAPKQGGVTAGAGAGCEAAALSRAGTAAGQQLDPTGADKSAAKLLWERAATKLKAVTRFRKKGGEAQGGAAARAARGPTPNMEPVVE